MQAAKRIAIVLLTTMGFMGCTTAERNQPATPKDATPAHPEKSTSAERAHDKIPATDKPLSTEKPEPQLPDKIVTPVTSPVLVNTSFADIYGDFRKKIESSGFKQDANCLVLRQYRETNNDTYHTVAIFNRKCNRESLEQEGTMTLNLRVQPVAGPNGQHSIKGWNTDWTHHLLLSGSPIKVGFGTFRSGVFVVGNLCSQEYAANCDLVIDHTGSISGVVPEIDHP